MCDQGKLNSLKRAETKLDKSKFKLVTFQFPTYETSYKHLKMDIRIHLEPLKKDNYSRRFSILMINLRNQIIISRIFTSKIQILFLRTHLVRVNLGSVRKVSFTLHKAITI